jgi:hypothetical protein
MGPPIVVTSFEKKSKCGRNYKTSGGAYALALVFIKQA